MPVSIALTPFFACEADGADTATDGYVRIVSQHASTILLSISLRFKGALKPVLDDCRRSATETLRIMRAWPDDSIEFGSNLLVVNLA